MGSLTENRSVFDGSYPWSDGGEEWSAFWGGSQAQWWGCLMPRLRSFIPAPRVLEIACGYGRWSRFLRELSDELVLVDISERCVNACRELFAADAAVRVEQTDGVSLPAVARSVDFAFSFDSLVHVEMEVVMAYLGELARVLAPAGTAFLHHSNLAAYADAAGEVAIRHHWRATSVSASVVRSQAPQFGLAVVSQETVNWGFDELTDCFTVLARSGSRWDGPPRLREHRSFMAEAAAVRALWEQYGHAPLPPLRPAVAAPASPSALGRLLRRLGRE
jgi:SAM-dependent methyltransferase